MTAPALHRWSMGFVFMRWRRVFWISPLLGVLVALIVHLGWFHRIDIRSTSHPIGEESGGYGILNDEVLTATAGNLGLAAKWNVSEPEAIARLQKGIVFTKVETDPQLIGISFLDFNPDLATEIPPALERYSAARAGRLEEEQERKQTREMLERQIAEADRGVKKWETELAAMDQKAANARPPEPSGKSRSRLEVQWDLDSEVGKREFFRKDLDREIQSEHGILASESVSCSFGPFPLVEKASLKQALLPACKRLGLGFGAGVLAAPLFAYLLERLVPRRRANL